MKIRVEKIDLEQSESMAVSCRGLEARILAPTRPDGRGTVEITNGTAFIQFWFEDDGRELVSSKPVRPCFNYRTTHQPPQKHLVDFTQAIVRAKTADDMLEVCEKAAAQIKGGADPLASAQRLVAGIRLMRERLEQESRKEMETGD